MKTILLADDSPFILETIAARLRGNGNEVITATNGQEALDAGSRVHPDLAILDVSMPVMNGLEAAKGLHKVMPKLPIILFTSYGEAMKSTLNEPGIVAVFDKGSSLRDLISTVDEYLWRTEKFGEACGNG